MKIPSIISFILLIFLGIYITSFKYTIYFPQVLFWCILLLLFTTIVYEIFILSHRNGISNLYEYAIILQILILAFFLRLLFVSNYNSLIGYDSYNEYVVFSQIAGNFSWNIAEINSYMGSYPILYIYGIIWSQVVGLSIFATAKWMPISFFYISPILIYLLSRRIFSKNTALYSLFGFAFLYISLFFHTGLQRESIALPLFLLTLYLLYMSIQNNKDPKFTILLIIISFTCVLSHHLTPFLLLIFFIILLLSFYIYKVTMPYTCRYISKINAENNFPVKSVLLYIIFIFGYWSYLKYTPFELFNLIFNESIAPTSSSIKLIVPNSIRYFILYYGEIFFGLVFAFISFLSLLLNNKRTIFDISLLLYTGISSLIMVLILYGLLFHSGGMGLGSRLESFVYVGLFILVSYVYAYNYNKHQKIIKYNIICICIILILFSMFNIYRISPDLYSNYTLTKNDTRNMLTDEELQSAIWLGIGRNDNVIVGYSLTPALLLTKNFNLRHGIISNDVEYVLHSSFDPSYTQQYMYKTNNVIYDNKIVIISYFKDISK